MPSARPASIARRSNSVCPATRWLPAVFTALLLPRSWACRPAGSSHSPASRTLRTKSRSIAVSGPYRVDTVPPPSSSNAGALWAEAFSPNSCTGSSSAASVATSAQTTSPVAMVRPDIAELMTIDRTRPPGSRPTGFLPVGRPTAAHGNVTGR